MMVEAGLGKQIQHTAADARFQITGAKNNVANPRVHDCTSTHGTGLQRHIQIATGQSIVAFSGCGCAQGHDFGVGARVVAVKGLVPALPDDLPSSHHHSPHRHFTPRARFCGQSECGAHEQYLGSFGHLLPHTEKN